MWWSVYFGLSAIDSHLPFLPLAMLCVRYEGRLRLLGALFCECHELVRGQLGEVEE